MSEQRSAGNSNSNSNSSGTLLPSIVDNNKKIPHAIQVSRNRSKAVFNNKGSSQSSSVANYTDPVSALVEQPNVSAVAAFQQQTTPRAKRSLPIQVSSEQPEPMLLVCAVVCRVCRALVPVVDGLTVDNRTASSNGVASSDESDQFNALDIGGRRMDTKQTSGQGVVKCTRCREHTPIRVPPEGKRYIRCICGCLFLTKIGAKRFVCPRESCRRFLEANNSLPY